MAFDFIVDEEKSDSCRMYEANTPRLDKENAACTNTEFCYCHGTPGNDIL